MDKVEMILEERQILIRPIKKLTEKLKNQIIMDKTKTIGMLIALLLMTSILGLITGMLWGWVLNLDVQNGLLYGGIIGAIIGLLNFLSINHSVKSGKVLAKEMIYSSGSIMTGIFIFSSIIALVIALLKWLFF
ncbi:MAG: hypothetical protein Q8O62_05965 [Aequorivita sp.]|nr:hypothetical protein [Aequorivita sp.]